MLIDTEYDIDSIRKRGVRDLTLYVLSLSLATLVLILSVIAILLRGSSLPVFIVSLVCIVLSAVFTWYQMRASRIGSLGECIGRVRGVDVELKSIRSTAGWDIGLFKRKYDSYRRDELRLGLAVENGEGIRLYKLWGVAPKHSEYYSVGDEVIHVHATRFPIKTEKLGEEYLCPICGEFENRANKKCTCCGTQVLK